MEPFASLPSGLPNVGAPSAARFSRTHGGAIGVSHQSPSLLFQQGQSVSSGLPLSCSLNDPHWRPEHHTGSNQARGKRLRVEDALSYLEQVKQQFAQAPEVYGDFLDIMKEFKSQTIDTPGVICRVSRLFRGKPNLIIGFNTFLPPGFLVRLEGARIIISEPNGQTRCIDDGSPDHVTSSAADVASERVLTPSANASTIDFLIRRVSDQDSKPPAENVAPAPQAAPDVPTTSQTTNESPTVGIENAMQYVSKIKTRFQDRPETYQKFLRILQDYQNHQKQRNQRQKDGDVPPAMEGQVYRSVAVLFKNEPDLLNEFSRFLPDASCFASCEQPQAQPESQTAKAKQQGVSVEHNAMYISPLVDAARTITPEEQASSPALPQTAAQKRAGSHVSSQCSSAKRSKTDGVKVLVSDVDVNEGLKLGSADDFLFFDKACRFIVRRLFTDEENYHSFLRSLSLYSQNIVSRSELIELVTPLLGRRPDLMKTLKEMLGMNETSQSTQPMEESQPKAEDRDGIPSGITYQIDFATCKRLGVSYRSLPDSYPRPVCSGRTPLCKSVLNDTWVSFPSWSSEDTSCVHSKKTQYEEFIYKTEDERFELDIIIEVNKAALENLIFLENKLRNMSKTELNKFRLDASLGSSSPSLMYRALKRIYGEHVHKMLEGAQKNPILVIPRLIERLRLKDSEWREAQAGFNRVWREQTEKYYGKSLDHQALTFKQNDLKLLRSKMIIHNFETLYDERETRMEEGGPAESGPHCIFDYPSTDTSVFYDVNDLIIHYVKRQQNIQKEEKKQAKRFLKRLIPEFFNIPSQPMSDEEDDEISQSTDEAMNASARNGTTSIERSNVPATKNQDLYNSQEKNSPSVTDGSTYRLFYGANTWCVFLRLHQMLCDRFARLKAKNASMIMDYKIEEKMRSASANKLDDNKDSDRGIHLLKKSVQNPENFYKDLICAIKNLLDGQVESAAFEDLIRSMFGTDAYITFTMDKIITTLGRQLQAMFTEELNIGTLDLYQKFRFKRPISYIVKTKNECDIEELYEAAAQKLLVNQNCFKTFFLHDRRKVTVELIDTETVDEGNEENDLTDKKWSQYINYYLKTSAEEPSTSALSAEEQQQLLEDLSSNRVFLMRNVRAGLENSRKKEDDVKRRGKFRGKSRYAKEKENSTVHVKEDLHVHFSPAGNYQMRFVEGAAEILIRNRAPRRGFKKHKAVVARRKERFTTWLEERLCEESGEPEMSRNWLSEGSKMIQVRHKQFPYLTYNRYITPIGNKVPPLNTRS
uniref:HDAC_interact domain-containing protein n=1 Tax=Syphacia muris TaxID=451379 RepID=A0A0N5AGI1_9BILA